MQHLGDSHRRESLGMRTPLLCEFANQRSDRRFAGLNLAAGKLEATRAMGRVWAATLDQQAIWGEPDEAGNDEETGLGRTLRHRAHT